MVDKNELILVIGQSGAGRTTVIHILDDQGFDTLDNVPVHLIPRVVPRELVDKPLALGLDIRSKSFSLKNLMKAISNWKALSKSSVVILFLECSLDVLIKRFSLTRRPHPVPGENNLELSIKRELKLIAPLREKADFVLDTSNTSPNELRLKLGSIFPLAKNRSIQIMLQSFSFRSGSPSGVDMVFDCRFLKNPNWEDDLKIRTFRVLWQGAVSRNDVITAYLIGLTPPPPDHLSDPPYVHSFYIQEGSILR